MIVQGGLGMATTRELCQGNYKKTCHMETLLALCCISSKEETTQAVCKTSTSKTVVCSLLAVFHKYL